MRDVAAIMVNWNGGELAVQSARSICKQSVLPSLWLVDNGSFDGSADAIAAACSGVHILRNDQNLAFAKGNNRAWSEINNAEFVLLVNNDVILPNPDALKEIITFLELHPEILSVCGRYEYPDGEFQHFYNQLPTALDLIVAWGIGRHWPWFIRGPALRRFHLQDCDFSQPLTIEQPAFSCVLLRGSSARQVGMFDEQFPIFLNDVDYCWRWRAQGWTWHYLPWWRIIHHKSRSTSKMDRHLQTELASSAVRFARKHFSPWLSVVICLTIVLEALWRKLRHNDFDLSIRDLWAGKSPFLQSQFAK